MQLSKKALTDLRKTIIKSYGEDLSNKLNDEELNEIGSALLTITSEALKIKVAKSRESKNAIQKPE
ncbi:MAG: hypothetical protein WCI91_02520 [Candidatus Nomurabacteria bacterium]